MITRLSLKNFRCFSNHTLDGFRRINIITGANGSGKTALLEGVYLGVLGIPHSVSRINGARGLTNVDIPPIPLAGLLASLMPAVSPEVFHSQWDNVFLNPALPATIEYVDDAEQNYSLSMHYSDLDRGVALPGTQALVKGSGMASAPTSVSPLVMVRRKSGEPERKIEITVNSFNQITYDPVTGPLGPPVAYFPSTVMYADSDNVLWFSQLSVANNEGGVVDAMRRIFPQITNLMILSLFGSQRMFAETAGKKLPLALVSAGMHKVLSLALALISYKKGLVVLDEMENGIFHERYADVWSLMHHLAVQYDTQVFVSSHSLECLEALIPVIKDHEPDFALFRTSNTASGPNIERVAGSALRAALEGRGEVR